MNVAVERMFVFSLLASTMVLGFAFFLPVEYQVEVKVPPQGSQHNADGVDARYGQRVHYNRSFSDSPSRVDITVFALPLLLALAQVILHGRGALAVSFVTPFVLLALLGVLGFNVAFFEFDLFSSRPPEQSYGGVVAIVAMASSFLFSLLVLAAKLNRCWPITT